MDLHGYNRALLAICLWREARGEGPTGMRAVGHVIRNRVKAWGQSWHRVICGEAQFTSMNPPGDRHDSQLDDWPDPHNQAGQDVLALAAAIYEDRDPDITRGALYYANLATMDKGGWFERNIVNKPAEHPVRAVLGNHTFYA